MSKFKVGDVIVQKVCKENRFKILEISGCLFHLGYKDSEKVLASVTEKWFVDYGYELAEKGRFVPKMDERFAFVGVGGKISELNWINVEMDKFLFSTGNCFHPDDKEGLEAYRLKLLELGN